jgi:hypothetical protein
MVGAGKFLVVNIVVRSSGGVGREDIDGEVVEVRNGVMAVSRSAAESAALFGVDLVSWANELTNAVC